MLKAPLLYSLTHLAAILWLGM